MRIGMPDARCFLSTDCDEVAAQTDKFIRSRAKRPTQDFVLAERRRLGVNPLWHHRCWYCPIWWMDVD